MLVRLFDIRKGKLTPTEHCYTILPLNNILEEYTPTISAKIFSVIHYLCDLNPETNPFANIAEQDKLERVIKDVFPNIDDHIDIESEMFIEALDSVRSLYETPTYRVYLSFKSVIDKLSRALTFVNISLNKEDGNSDQIAKAKKAYDDIKVALKNSFKEYQDEMEVGRKRGGGTKSIKNPGGRAKQLT